MKDTKLPFKEYTVMSNNLIQNLNCSDVYRAYTLLLTADKDSLETNTTLKQLAGFVGEELDNYKKSKSTLSFNDKLRATGEVVIRDIDSKQKDRHWTMYRFNQVEPGNYRRIGREFYDTYNTLDLKLRGFILKLFSVTEPHSYVIKLSSIRKLKELIHMGHSTISRYYLIPCRTLFVEGDLVSNGKVFNIFFFIKVVAEHLCSQFTVLHAGGNGV